jgi:hypothetical protein
MAKSTENAKAAESAAVKNEKRFEKSKLCKSKKFEKQRYLLDTVLEDGVTYTVEEAEKIVNDYIKKEV